MKLVSERKVLEEKDLDDWRRKNGQPNSIKGILESVQNRFKEIDYLRCFSKIISLFPMFGWLRNYKWKTDLKNDIFLGMTWGVIQIPQGLVCGKLSNVTPISGLYVSFITPLIYMLFGSSKHLSLATFSVIALLVGSVVSSPVTEAYAQSHNITVNDTSMPMDIIQAKYIVAGTLTTLVGIFQLIFSCLNMGFISNLLSNNVTNAFVFGSSILVFTTQAQYMLGVKLVGSPSSSISPFLQTYISLFSRIKTINFAELTIAGVSLVISLILKQLGGIIERKWHFIFPAELIILIIADLASHYGNFESNYNVRVVGDIPPGLPGFILPDFTLFKDLMVPAFFISLVSYVSTVSLARGLANKHGYKVSFNQELFAYGSCNLISSFFYCFVCGGSLSRSVIATKIGKSQLASLLSSIIIILILLFVAQLFKPLPYTTLAIIMVVPLANIFKQVLDLKEIFKLSKIEAFIWVVTALGTVFLDVTYGLLIGILINVLKLFYQLFRPHSALLTNVNDYGIYKDSLYLKNCQEKEGYKIFQFQGPLIYLNKETFSAQIYKHSQKKIMALRGPEEFDMIVDGKNFQFVDMEGCHVLVENFNQLKQTNIEMVLANLNERCYLTINDYLNHMKVEIRMFPTIDDAVVYVTNKRQTIASENP